MTLLETNNVASVDFFFMRSAYHKNIILLVYALETWSNSMISPVKSFPSYICDKRSCHFICLRVFLSSGTQ